MPSLSPAHALRLFLAAALLTLGTAFTAQYAFHLAPCEMCWWQRYPYMAMIALGLLGLTLPAATQRRMLYAMLLLWLISAGLGWYHAGVEWRLFEGPSHCAGEMKPAASLEALKQSILSKPIVLCNQPAFVFLGLSMAGWNGLFSSLMLLLNMFILHRNKEPSHA